jgi:hypothetical protein
MFIASALLLMGGLYLLVHVLTKAAAMGDRALRDELAAPYDQEAEAWADDDPDREARWEYAHDEDGDYNDGEREDV